MKPVNIIHGAGPIVLGMPHIGTFLPNDIGKNLNDNGLKLADTDWHIERLFEGLFENATCVQATFHRYVIDANRDPIGQSLYPGQNTTSLVPLSDFDGVDIWKTAPTADKIEQRLGAFHAPYHAALRSELERVRDLHGFAILFDCHSIRSHIPFLFDGVLPDLNIGTNNGTTCAPSIERVIFDTAKNADGFSAVLNGRFKGGWTTRHYGKPATGIHAIQLEIAQSTYLSAETPPWNYDPVHADKLRVHLKSMLTSLVDLTSTLGDSK
jgi:formiminoglutamase